MKRAGILLLPVYLIAMLTVVHVCNGDTVEHGFPAVQRRIVTERVIYRANRDHIIFTKVSPDGKSVALVSQDKALFSRRQDSEQLIYNGKKSGYYLKVYPNLIRFSPDSTRLAYTVWYRGHACPVIDGRVITADGHASDIVPVHFSPDSRRTAYAFYSLARKEWRMVIDGKADPGFPDIVPEAFCFSPDSQRYAYMATNNNKKMVVVVDGRTDPCYDGILGKLSFTPDSKHYSYLAILQGRSRLIVDGQVADQAYHEGNIIRYCYSPDSRRFAFCLQGQSDSKMIVDGKIDGTYQALGDLAPAPPARSTPVEIDALAQKYVTNEDVIDRLMTNTAFCFSPDSRHLAYAALLPRPPDADVTVVRDGKSGERWDGVYHANFCFSSNSQRFAYEGVKDQRSYVVIDGQREGPYAAIMACSLTFSPDSRHVAYTAISSDKLHRIVLDGKEEPAYTATSAPCFSPDSRALAYIALRDTEGATVVVNGQRGKTYYDMLMRSLRFAANDRLHYLARDGDKILYVEEMVGKT